MDCGWEKWDGGGNLNVHWGLMRMEVWIRLGGWGGWLEVGKELWRKGRKIQRM